MEVWKVGVRDQRSRFSSERLAVIQISVPRRHPRPDTSAESLRNDVIVGRELLGDVDETGCLFVATPPRKRLCKVGGNDCPGSLLAHQLQGLVARAQLTLGGRVVPGERLDVGPDGAAHSPPVGQAKLLEACARGAPETPCFLELASHRQQPGEAAGDRGLNRLVVAGFRQELLASRDGLVGRGRVRSRATSRAGRTSAASSRGSAALSRVLQGPVHCFDSLSPAPARAPRAHRSASTPGPGRGGRPPARGRGSRARLRRARSS